ncbi:MAG: NMD3-related protein [Promethearchaeota archaeon]
MPNRFCAICGKEISENDPHFGMCYNCYLKEKPLFELPKRFSFNYCMDCGSYSKKEEWVSPKSIDIDLFSIINEAVNKFLLEPYLKKDNIKFSIIYDEKSYVYSSKDLLKNLDIIIKGILKGNTNIKHQETINLIINYLLCKNCTNLRGGTYYVSIIQLRVKDETQFNVIEEAFNNINKFVEKLFEKDHKQYISKVEDQKFGLDLYLSTNELMNYIIRQLRKDYHFLTKRTKKLIGRDIQRGKNLFRYKTLIKFLPIQKNDIVIINNEDFLVENITKNKILLRNKNNLKLIKDYSYFFNENIVKKDRGSLIGTR